MNLETCESCGKDQLAKYIVIDSTDQPVCLECVEPVEPTAAQLAELPEFVAEFVKIGKASLIRATDSEATAVFTTTSDVPMLFFYHRQATEESKKYVFGIEESAFDGAPSFQTNDLNWATYYANCAVHGFQPTAQFPTLASVMT